MSTYRQNDIFRRGSDFRLNACVGTNGGLYDFSDYARGYFLAAENVLASLRQDSACVDILVYPLAFLFRHGIELSLKGLARELSELAGAKTNVKLTHKLSDNWSAVKQELVKRSSHFDTENRLIQLVDQVLKDYLEFDPVGEVFRFPEDRGGNLFLQEARIINVEVLGGALKQVADAFDYWFYVVSAQKEYERECKNEG
jgi:hypothetical protein